MKRLLLIMPCIPYPEREHGFAIRYYPFIQQLSEEYILDAFFLLKSAKYDAAALSKVRHYFQAIEVVDNKRSKRVSAIRKLLSLFSLINPRGVPHALYSYFYRDNADAISRMAASNDYYRFVFVGTSNSQELLYLVKNGLDREKVVVDMIDSISLLHSRGFGNQGVAGRMRFAKLARWERKIIEVSDATMYVSSKDKEFISKFLVTNENVYVSPNGVHVADYSTKSFHDTTPSIGFLGNMSYPPNIKGALFAYEVYKRYQREYGKIKFYIIGRDPVSEIRELAEDEDVIVTGTVEDIWPYVNTVSVFVIMLLLGAGQQNKMLEIMYASRPVIANAVANAGIQGDDGKHLFLADTVEECTDILAMLLRDAGLRHSIGRRGSEFVKEKYGRDVSYQTYAAILD